MAHLAAKEMWLSCAQGLFWRLLFHRFSSSRSSGGVWSRRCQQREQAAHRSGAGLDTAELALLPGLRQTRLEAKLTKVHQDLFLLKARGKGGIGWDKQVCSNLKIVSVSCSPLPPFPHSWYKVPAPEQEWGRCILPDDRAPGLVIFIWTTEVILRVMF